MIQLQITLNKRVFEKQNFYLFDFLNVTGCLYWQAGEVTEHHWPLECLLSELIFSFIMGAVSTTCTEKSSGNTSLFFLLSSRMDKGFAFFYSCSDSKFSQWKHRLELAQGFSTIEFQKLNICPLNKCITLVLKKPSAGPVLENCDYVFGNTYLKKITLKT